MPDLGREQKRILLLGAGSAATIVQEVQSRYPMPAIVSVLTTDERGLLLLEHLADADFIIVVDDFPFDPGSSVVQRFTTLQLREKLGPTGDSTTGCVAETLAYADTLQLLPPTVLILCNASVGSTDLMDRAMACIIEELESVCKDLSD